MKDLTKEVYFTDNRLTTAIEIEKLANELLAITWTIDIYRFQDAKVVNLLDLGWRFEFNTRKIAAGLCSKRKKTIYISKWLFDQNPHKSLEFENVLRHELAHALDFEIRGKSDHGKVWKLIARKVLCTAERCSTSEQIGVTATTKYTLICDTCNKEQPSHKRLKNSVACGECCKEHNRGRYDVKYVLRQVQNY
jgi:predicted SprT family Zn-dependent metalloprotease